MTHNAAVLDDAPGILGDGRTLAEILDEMTAHPFTRPTMRWSPGRMDVPEDEDGECFYCHGSPGPAGCGQCGALGS